MDRGEPRQLEEIEEMQDAALRQGGESIATLVMERNDAHDELNSSS